MEDGPVAYHDRLATEWEERYRRGGFRRRSVFIKSMLARLARPGGSWLDVGCGSGHFSRYVGKKVDRVVGIDGSFAMVDAARRLSTLEGLGHKLFFEQVGQLQLLSFKDGSFAGCMALSVLEYLDDPATCLSEMVRVLRPGGTLLISVPNTSSIVRATQAVLYRSIGSRVTAGSRYISVSKHSWSRGMLARQLESLGVGNAEIIGFDPVLPGALGRLSPSLWLAIGIKA